MKCWSYLSLAAFAASSVVLGCGAEPADAEVLETEGDALSYASLKGTWTGGAGNIRSLTLTKDPAEVRFPPGGGGPIKGYVFTATVQFERKVTAITGVYKVKGSHATFLDAQVARSSELNDEKLALSRVLGEYKLSTKNKVTTLILNRLDDARTVDRDEAFSQSFTKDTPTDKCGTATCGAGTVCCNPLASVCTPVGGFCML